MQFHLRQPVAVILSAVLTTGLFSSTAFAADAAADTTKAAAETTAKAAAEETKAELPNLTTEATKTTAETTKAETAKAETTKAETTKAETTKAETTQAATTKETTSTKEETTATTESKASITDSTTQTSEAAVRITNSETGTKTSGVRSSLPKITGGYVLTPAQVPPTANAPYMQHSNLPAGTVFIAVGAILGFFALAVLLWRVLSVWALKRSVKRAALANSIQDSKILHHNFRAPAPPLYKYSDRDSTLSLANLGKKANKANKPSTTSAANPPNQSLFFSPTAPAGGSSLLNPSNRGSAYLPSGYYAAGASAPGNGTGMAHLGGPGLSAREAISLSNLGPHAAGYSRARSMGTTPPDSPSAPPTLSATGHATNMSTSTLDLGQRPAARAPSAYLDDLFDEAGAAPGNYPVNHPNYQGNNRL